MIIWGTKRVEKRLGYVAENCPRCQVARCVKVVRLGMAGHVYFVAVNAGRLLGHFGRCEQCAGEFSLEPSDYPEMDQSRKAPLAEMAVRTNPMLQPTVEQQRKESRLRALREPFLRVNQSIEDRAGTGTHLDWPAGLAILGTILLTATLGIAAANAAPYSRSGEILGWLAAASFFGGMSFSFWLLHGESERFFRNRLLPVVHASLEPLRPERGEVDETLARLAKYRYRIARIMRPEDRTPGFVRG